MLPPASTAAAVLLLVVVDGTRPVWLLEISGRLQLLCMLGGAGHMLLHWHLLLLL
jgi:hypothetical protein